MKKIILTLLIVLPLFVSAQRGAYLLKLKSAELNGSSAGSIVIDSIKPSQLLLYNSAYADSLISIVFKFSRKSFPFELTNNSKSSIKVNWNDASYIDYLGSSKKLMHTGVKYIDRNENQPETTLIKGAKLSDQFTPTENVYFEGGTYGSGWEVRELFPEVKKKETPTLIGKEVKLYLPIMSNGVRQEYIFTFDLVFNDYIKK
ncbi:hypothetical protein [Pedobacter sp.]